MSYNFSRTGTQIEAIHTKVDGIEALADVTATAETSHATVVVGPASATNGYVALYDGTTGKLLKDSTLDPAIVATSAGVFVDNTLVKADGTGRGVQDSGIVVTDTNNVYGGGTESNIQTGTTYAPVLTDAGKLITLSNAAAITLTIPANAAVAFPVGTVINLLQLGAGQVTVALTSDTLLSKGDKVALTGQYSPATLVKTAATTWVLFGDLA